ncbi:glycoside hydrolase [Skermanella mucosa]|uniref:glycoside hydrolase family 17 protein n=1 Tax=Skermanella mucosa TaxID=1789672 RepID=UPI00192C213A|nr:glycoside hydrolase [Skermanella mucosa]UEM21527.1 glycoside hydrolase [Skermanella mucosa]
MRVPVLLAVLAVAILGNFALWALPNRPQPLEPPPGGKLQSVSFAPFRDGQSPLTMVYPTPAQIEEDLRLLKDEVTAVRTYTSREGLENVPPLARDYGIKVMQGSWIGPKTDLNEKEIAAQIRLANEYPDVIDRVIVGNEVLLRGDRTVDQLVEYIRRVKAQVKQPVTYADVWEWWLKYPQVADEVDFITIHLLPYWEDVPAGVEGAEERILEAYREIRERFPGKPILVGEVGWPTAGRTRGPAETGLVNKARFVNLFVRMAEREGFQYNIVEAFDQGWKSANEGTVGANWGLFSADRERKFSLAGPVVENPDWMRHFALSSGLAIAAVLAAAAAVPGLATRLSPGRALALAVLAQGMASALVLAGHVAWTQTYYPFETVRAALLFALEVVLAAAILDSAARLLADPRDGKVGVLAGAGTAAAWTMAAVAVVATALLIFDGRYRDFPVPDYLVPGLALPALGLVRLVLQGGGPNSLTVRGALGGASAAALPSVLAGRAALALAVLLPLGAVGIVIREGTVNTEAMAWAGLLVLTAVPYAAAIAAARSKVSSTKGILSASR